MMNKKYLLLSVVIAIGIILYGYYDYSTYHKKFLSYFEEIRSLFSVASTSAANNTTAIKIRVPILTYHSIVFYPHSEYKIFTKLTVMPDVFEKQLQYLKDNHYQIISLQSLVNYLINKTPLPDNPVILTFDDGWNSQFLYALPLLKKYNATATFFIFTNSPGHKHFMSWDEIRELDKKAMTIGSHTVSHPYLLKIENRNKIRSEIIDSKKILEKQLSHPVYLFAYPFGHYNEKIIDIVKEAGYLAARSTYKGIYHTPDDLYTLKSIEVTNDFNEFVKELNQ